MKFVIGPPYHVDRLDLSYIISQPRGRASPGSLEGPTLKLLRLVIILLLVVRHFRVVINVSLGVSR